MNRKKWIIYNAPLIVCVLAIIVLIIIPTGYEDRVQYQEADRCVAEVVEVDNSSIVDTGLVRSGEQRCKICFENGNFEGKEATGVNMLQGSLEQDKLFGHWVCSVSHIICRKDRTAGSHFLCIDHTDSLESISAALSERMESNLDWSAYYAVFNHHYNFPGIWF